LEKDEKEKWMGGNALSQRREYFHATFSKQIENKNTQKKKKLWSQDTDLN